MQRASDIPAENTCDAATAADTRAWWPNKNEPSAAKRCFVFMVSNNDKSEYSKAQDCSNYNVLFRLNSLHNQLKTKKKTKVQNHSTADELHSEMQPTEL